MEMKTFWLSRSMPLFAVNFEYNSTANVHWLYCDGHLEALRF